MSIMVDVQDVDAFVKQAVVVGAKVITPVENKSTSIVPAAWNIHSDTTGSA